MTGKGELRVLSATDRVSLKQQLNKFEELSHTAYFNRPKKKENYLLVVGKHRLYTFSVGKEFKLIKPTFHLLEITLIKSSEPKEVCVFQLVNELTQSSLFR
eukprot:TRINITY_DN8457_c0_g1_i1.p1 TRINITY_DN8457_c0_g1~~TRINITY_DN8457_c0_g1_i1.p1  ORF type:complete len:116 (-),score=25.35 TRINITY_DN8457_c0_g1_i1:226-528(-)